MPAAAAVQRPHRRLVCCFALTAVSVQLLASLRTAEGFGTTPAGCSGCSTAGCSLYDSCQLYDAHSTAFVAYGGCALLSKSNSAHRIQHIVTTTQCRKCCGEKKAMEFFCRRAREACTKACKNGGSCAALSPVGAGGHRHLQLNQSQGQFRCACKTGFSGAHCEIAYSSSPVGVWCNLLHASR